MLEHLFHLLGKAGLIDKGIDLKIVFEAAEIHVGRSDATELVIDDQHLGMEESRFVEIDLGPGFHHIIDEGVAGHVDTPGV